MYEIKQTAPSGGSQSAREERFKDAMLLFARWVAEDPHWSCAVYAVHVVDGDVSIMYPMAVYTPARRT